MRMYVKSATHTISGRAGITLCGFQINGTSIPVNPGQSFGKKIDFRTRRFAILDLDLNEGLMNGETEAGETY